MDKTPYPIPNHCATYLLISRVDMDFDLVSSMLNIKPSAMVKAGEVPIPTLAQGVYRYFDPRLAQDLWKKYLSGRQYNQPFEEQLKYWVSLLNPARAALVELSRMGYWAVLDCNVHQPYLPVGSVQFRLSRDLRLKLSKLPVDIDFTIYAT